MRKIFLFSILFFTSFPLQAFAEIKGYALLRLASKKEVIEFEQAVIVDDDKAVFSALDEMGSEIFRVIFDDFGMAIVRGGQVVKSGKDDLKKLVALPLPQAEFLKILRYTKPEGFSVVPDEPLETWCRDKGKKLSVTFKSFMDVNKKKFPRHIRIESKANTLDLRWLDVSVKEVKKKSR